MGCYLGFLVGIHGIKEGDGEEAIVIVEGAEQSYFQDSI